MRRTKQQWLELIQAQNSSPLSIKAYCRENQVATSTFYKKRHDLSLSLPNELPLSPFIAVNVDSIPSLPCHDEITLTIGQVNVVLSNNTNAHWLATLIGEIA